MGLRKSAFPDTAMIVARAEISLILFAFIGWGILTLEVSTF